MSVILFCCLLCFLKPATSFSPSESAASEGISINVSSVPLIEIEKEIQNVFLSATNMVMPYFLKVSNLNLSPSCFLSLTRFFFDLRKLKTPALKMFDASAKFPNGILSGNFAVMGDYDECLAIKPKKKREAFKSGYDSTYRSQYCSIEMLFPPQMISVLKDYNLGRINLTDLGRIGQYLEEVPAKRYGSFFRHIVGVCVPATCSVYDLDKLLTLVPVSSIPMKVSRCDNGQKKSLNPEQITFLFVLALMVLLVLLGTLIDSWLHIKNSECRNDHPSNVLHILLAFSIYRNTRKLLEEEKVSRVEVPATNALYVTAMFFVILFHAYYVPFTTLFSSHSSNMITYSEDFGFTFIATQTINIELFFLISGLLLVYPRFYNNEAPKIKIPKLVLTRYFRLCPSLLFILGITVTLPILGSGPIWMDIFGKAAENSRKWWWTYALMFNNFLANENQGFIYLWYIPCLMQITLVGIFLAWIMAKNAKLGIFLTIAGGMACSIGLGILTAIKHYPPSPVAYYFYNQKYFQQAIYFSPLSHASSYGIGMILGYYMAKTPTLKLTKTTVIIGWIISLVLTFGTEFLLYIVHDGSDPDAIFTAAYAAIHRPAFSLGASWILIACKYGYAGFLGKICSWRGFTPLSKLMYFTYLIHFIVIAYHVSVARIPLMYSHYEIWMRFSSYLLLSLILAYFLYISFELPLRYVESLIMYGKPNVQNMQIDSSYVSKNNIWKEKKIKNVFKINNSLFWNKTVHTHPNKETEHSKL